MTVAPSKILIQGPGAIGRWVASRLVASGDDVTFLARESVEAPDGCWLELRSDGADPAGARVPVVTPRALETATPANVDVLFVAVKAFDVAEALETGSRFLQPGGLVVLLSNGLGHLATAREVWPADQVLAATVVGGAMIPEDTVARAPGHDGSSIRCWPVIETGAGPWRLGLASGGAPEEAGGSVSAAMLMDRLHGAGIDVSWVDSVESAIWTKAAVNCAINPVASMLGLPNGRLIGNPALDGGFQAAAEAVQVAARMGIETVKLEDVREVVERVCTATARNRCSMLEDLDAGRRTEIDFLNGRVVEFGDQHGESVQVNRTLTRMIKGLEMIDGRRTSTIRASRN